ncbi:GntR family transcriptional regulator [Amycolatopsis sp. NPDC051128]|uniref:GntR family transcriptional regulator n=1 Tax=Amycolatopsis sp. NPDC051128 TaxID=3155412 RepID=UPI003424DA52
MKTDPAQMAPFESIADQLRKRIVNGDLAKGAKLPSSRELASTYNVAIMTAQKAVRLLVEQGWAVSRSSLGTYVSSAWDEVERTPTLRELATRVQELEAQVAALQKSVGRSEAGQS